MKCKLFGAMALVAPMLALPAVAEEWTPPVTSVPLPVLQAQLNFDAQAVAASKATLATDMKAVAGELAYIKTLNANLASASKAGLVAVTVTDYNVIQSQAGVLAPLKAKVAADAAALKQLNSTYNADKALRNAALGRH